MLPAPSQMSAEVAVKTSTVRLLRARHPARAELPVPPDRILPALRAAGKAG
jgi:hypothetical protein